MKEFELACMSVSLESVIESAEWQNVFAGVGTDRCTDLEAVAGR